MRLFAAAPVDQALFVQSEEKMLSSLFARIRPEVEQEFARQDYTAALKRLASLRDAVDAFFDKVMVMDKDERLRRNRVAFLAELHAAMNRIADLSKLAV